MIHRYIIEATDEVKGFEEAIERLDREWGIEELEPCEDAVSKRTVKEQMIKYGFSAPDMTVTEFVEDLPSVNSTKIGHWRHYEGMLICSDCGAEFYDDIMEYCGDVVPKCCPNCGAKMQEVEE